MGKWLFAPCTGGRSADLSEWLIETKRYREKTIVELSNRAIVHAAHEERN
jgi:hypothetical protein